MSLSSALTSNTARESNISYHPPTLQHTQSVSSAGTTTIAPPGPQPLPMAAQTMQTLPASNTWAGLANIHPLTNIGLMQREVSDPTVSMAAAQGQVNFDPNLMTLTDWYNQLSLQQLSPLAVTGLTSFMHNPFNPLISPTTSHIFSPMAPMSPILGNPAPASNQPLFSGVSRTLEQYSATLLRNQLDQSQQQAQVTPKATVSVYST